MNHFGYMEIHGPADSCHAFVEGYRLGRGETQLYFADEIGLHLPSFLDALASRLHRETHIIGPVDLLREISAATEKTGRLKLEAGDIQTLEKARLEFEFQCYSRADGEAIRKVIENDLPENVQLEDYSVDETVDEEARGPELYAPLHDYVLKGSGTYWGAFKGILMIARRLSDQDFIHPKKIELELAD